MFLTKLSLKRPVLATVVILALITMGIIGYMNLNVNDWPEAELPYIVVTIVEPGASPDQLENRVAQPVEDTLGQIAGVKHIMTRVQENAVTVIMEFRWGVDPGTAAQEIREKLGAIRADLPEDIKEPIVAQYNPQSTPILTVAVTGTDISQRVMSDWVDGTLRPRLETVVGVGSLDISGIDKREIQVWLDKDRMTSFGMTTAEVVGGIKSEHLDVPAGAALSTEGQIALSSAGERKNIAELERIPVGKRGDTTIFLGDIAVIEDGLAEAEERVYYQGLPAIGLDIIKQSGSNTVQVADDVHGVLEELEVPAGIEIKVMRDNSQNIRNSLADVQRTLLEGAILAVLTVLLFLKDWRSTLISALAIPTSIITTFWIMNLLDFTLNTVSLVALSLSVGLLIDDAIVVVENIYRHLQMGKKPLQAARDATDQVGLAVTATTFAVVAVFLPVGMTTGVVGQYLKEFGITVATSVMVSLLVAFTLVPLLASRVLREKTGERHSLIGRALDKFNQGFDKLSAIYVKALDQVLSKYRGIVFAGTFLLFAGSMLLMTQLPSAFITTGDSGEFTMEVSMDAGLNLDAAQGVTGQIEAVASAYPEVTEVYSITQRDQSRIMVNLLDKGERERDIFELAQSLRKELTAIPNAQTAILIKDFANMETKGVEYRLLGDEGHELMALATQVEAVMESIPGAVDVESSYKPGNPEQRLEIRSEAAADLGVSTGFIADTLYTMFTGTVVGQLEDGEQRIDIRVRLPEDQREVSSALTGIYLPTTPKADGTAALVDLNQVVQPVFASTPGEINRFDRSREVVVSCNLYGTSLGEFNQAFTDKVEQEIQLPPDIRLITAGYADVMEEAFNVILIAMITGILFIFFVMAAQFESFIDPLAILLSLPMAIIGAVLGLFFAGSELSIISLIGFIMLIGLVTKNAILLIDFAKQEMARGVATHRALLNAATIRVRPIVMTSTAMIFGMLPLALALGAGSETRSPMAHAVIGGLISSTLLTLFVVPILYTWLDDLRRKFTGRSVKRQDKPAEIDIQP